MDCSRFEEILFLSCDDGQLEQETILLYRQHVELCPECARRAAYTSRLLAVLRQRCRRAAAPDRLREKILSSLPHRGVDG